MKNVIDILRGLLNGNLSEDDSSALFNSRSFKVRQRKEWDDSVNLHYSDETDGYRLLKTVQSVLWGKSRIIPFSLKAYMVAASILSLVLLGSTIWFYKKSNYAEPFQTYVMLSGKKDIESIRLSDGTKVSLGPGSRLEYPKEFTGKKRLVFLYGQAFFNVAKNAEKPFTVKTSQFEVTALGTEFEVFSYGKKETAETILLKGKVKVDFYKTSQYEMSSCILIPNRKLSLNAQGRYLVEDINADNYTIWRNGKGLKFINEKLSVIIPRLEKWYGTNIRCNKDIAEKYRFSFSIDNESFGEVMNIIDKISPLKVKENNNIYIIEKQTDV